MGKIWTLTRKDIRILIRDKGSFFWVVGFPFLFALFFGAIFSGSGGRMSGMKIAAVDEDSTAYSQSFIAELDTLPSAEVTTMARDSAFDAVRQGKYVACVVLKKGFGQTMGLFGGSASVEIGIDPARQAETGYLRGMLMQTTFTLMQRRYSSADSIRQQLNRLTTGQTDWGGLDSTQRHLATGFLSNLADFMGTMPTADSTGAADSAAVSRGDLMPIDVVSVTADAAQPHSGFEIFFPSALLWALIACAASFGVSIVKERTAGTFLRLRLAPITRAHILAGKGIACFLTCLFVCVLLLAVGNVIFGVRIAEPGILLLALLSSSLAFVGIMMMISVLGKTEEAVGGAGWAILLVLAMAGGAMVPSFIMPDWLKTIGMISPVKWGILSFEAGIWRGFTLSEMMLPVGILLGIAVVGFTAGVIILARSER
jgi:ABC-2 type transport system permease protein